MSYSQNAEEAAILKACANAEPKRFLDIGAYHPTKISNTRALYEAGWEGVMIDPNPGGATADGSLEGMIALLDEYSESERVILIAAAVMPESGYRTLFIDGPLSTLDEDRYHEHASCSLKELTVPCITLEQLFQQFGGGYGFINIDTEGSSAELALQLLKLTRETHCICVEYDSPDNRGLLTAMTEADYRLVYSSAENGVFVKMTWEEMHP